MTRGKNRSKKCDWYSPNYFQSADYNKRTVLLYEHWILQLATNRFRWEGLPDTCNVRILEQTLTRYGHAAICTPNGEDLPPVWYSLPAAMNGKLTAYGEPTKWLVNGIAGGTHFKSDWEHGAWVWYNRSHVPIWNALSLFARRLAHITRTEDVNLFAQHTPAIIFTTDELKRDAYNVLEAMAGGEPAIVANKNMLESMEVKAVDLQTPYIGEQLQQAQRNLFNTIYRYLGIETLAYEKQERLITDEVRTNNAPASLMLLDAIEARRDACNWLNDNFGLDVHVYFNTDIESYNFNFANDMERSLEAGAPVQEGGNNA